MDGEFWKFYSRNNLEDYEIGVKCLVEDFKIGVYDDTYDDTYLCNYY